MSLVLSSREVARLVREALLGRYKNGGFGWVAFPRSISPLRKGRTPDFSRESRSRGYANLARCRERDRPLGWPMGPHSLKELERHLLETLGDSQETRLLIDQADCYPRAWRGNLANVSQRLRSGARAFLALWHLIESLSQDSCQVCRDRVLKRQRLSSRKLPCETIPG